MVDYLRWRHGEAARTSLQGWCYWTLRKEGLSATHATAALEGKTIAEKNELLFQRGINFNEVPSWQRRGSVVRWETYEKEGVDPRFGEPVKTTRRRLAVDRELPMGDAYSEYIRAALA